MFGIGIIKGLKTTLKAFFSRPVTILWPYEKPDIASQGQGLIRLRMVQLEPPVFKCVACLLCMKECPQHCITVIKKDGEKQPEKYTVDYGLCMFCRVCIDVCPFDALEQTQEHEFIGYHREDFIREKEELTMKTIYVPPEKEKTEVKDKTEVKEKTEEKEKEKDGEIKE